MTTMTKRPSRRRTDHELRGQYRALRAQMLRRWAAERAQCWFGCPGRLDFTLPYPDPRSVTVNHITPVGAESGIHELDTRNFAPAHLRCNQIGAAAFADGDPGEVLDTGRATEDWT